MFNFIPLGKNASSSLKRKFTGIENISIEDLNHGRPYLYLPIRNIIFCYRDPIERYISSWRSRYEMGWPRYYKRPWYNKEISLFSKFSKPEDYIQSMISKGEKFSPMFGHQTPQSEVLSRQNINDIKFIINFNDINNSLDKMLDLLDIECDNKLSHLHSNRLDKEEVKGRTICPDDYKILSESSRTWLKEGYKEDYKLKELMIKFNK
jgi:hypothetical protein